VTLRELSAQSANDNWQAMFIKNPTQTIHKLLKLDSLAIYFNTETVSFERSGHLEKAFTSSVSNIEWDIDHVTHVEKIASGGVGIEGYQYLLKPVSGIGKVSIVLGGCGTDDSHHT
jgi:vacuolar protein sorting-associated protein 13A/C